jgi:hypothetical protein
VLLRGVETARLAHRRHGDGVSEEGSPWPAAPPTVRTTNRTPIARSRPFLLLTLTFALSCFAMYAVVLLEEAAPVARA